MSITALVFVFVFAGLAHSGLIPGVEFVIAYDGYVEMRDGLAAADTLIVVNNVDPTTTMPLWLEIFDKHGSLVWEGEFFNGGTSTPRVKPNGYGWITLGMILQMTGVPQTLDPFENPGATKFYIRISGKYVPPSLRLIPSVEIKQVVYQSLVNDPGTAIWQSTLFKTWTETALGGNKFSPGMIWSLY